MKSVLFINLTTFGWLLESSHQCRERNIIRPWPVTVMNYTVMSILPLTFCINTHSKRVARVEGEAGPGFVPLVLTVDRLFSPGQVRLGSTSLGGKKKNPIPRRHKRIYLNKFTIYSNRFYLLILLLCIFVYTCFHSIVHISAGHSSGR